MLDMAMGDACEWPNLASGVEVLHTLGPTCAALLAAFGTRFKRSSFPQRRCNGHLQSSTVTPHLQS